MITVVSIFSIFRLVRSGDVWLGWLYLLILVAPLSGAVFIWRSRKPSAVKTASAEKLSNLLFAFHGVALACWAYDLATTFYAIDISRVATEINPLGWPLGALGAFSYYAPTVILTYVLLFKMKAKISVYAAVPITLVALLMGMMNLNAGVENFKVFLYTAMLPVGVRDNLLAVIATVDVAYVAVLLATVSKNRIFSLRKLTPWKN
jgi:hypothetical protein